MDRGSYFGRDVLELGRLSFKTQASSGRSSIYKIHLKIVKMLLASAYFQLFHTAFFTRFSLLGSRSMPDTIIFKKKKKT